MEDTLEAAMERLNRSVERMLQQRAEHITLNMVEDAIDVAIDDSEARSELEGIHSITESSSSLCDVVNHSESLMSETAMNVEVENSAHQVFDEMPHRVLDGIETQFSDIFICRTILSENSVGFVDKDEVSSEFETSAYKVFVFVKLNCDEIRELISSRESLGFVYDFWGQKSHKEGVLGTQLAIGSFGWKPGWISSTKLGSEGSFLEDVNGQGFSGTAGNDKINSNEKYCEEIETLARKGNHLVAAVLLDFLGTQIGSVEVINVPEYVVVTSISDLRWFGRAEGERFYIIGRTASGYTTLVALAFKEPFKIGAVVLMRSKGNVIKEADFLENAGQFKEATVLEPTDVLMCRALEVVLGATSYSAAVDMWLFGCIIAEIITTTAIIAGNSLSQWNSGLFQLRSQI